MGISNPAANAEDRSDAWVDWSLFRASRWPLIFFISALVLAYGFEVFSFNLTIDEEWAGDLTNVSYARIWQSQGRWSMALLTLLVPNQVVPVVSTGIGVALSGAAWWILCRKYLSLGPWASAVAASLAGTLPTLAFIFAFSTIAFGIGVGNLLLAAYLWGLSSNSWRNRVIGVFAAAAAVGIYDPFLLAIALLSLAFIYQRARVFSVVLGVAAPALAFLLSKLFALGLGTVLGPPNYAYVNDRLDFKGLVDHPILRSRTAMKSFGDTLWLSTDKVGLHTPWLAVVVIVLVPLAVFGIWRLGGSKLEIAIRVAVLILTLFVPLSAELSSLLPVDLRSMVYLPIMILVLVAFAAVGISGIPLTWVKRAVAIFVASLVLLAVVGQATISNRMFAAAATRYAADENLAFTIGQEKDRLTGNENTADLRLVVSGAHEWPQSMLTPTRDVLGASFFAWEGGSRGRTATFLRSQGVRVHAATAAEAQEAWPWLAEMPAYPQPGWIGVRDGMLLLNFGPRTPNND